MTSVDLCPVDFCGMCLAFKVTFGLMMLRWFYCRFSLISLGCYLESVLALHIFDLRPNTANFFEQHS